MLQVVSCGNIWESWKDNIKIDSKEIGREAVSWTEILQNTVHCQACALAVLICPVLIC
jgi:hypothetical protein